MATIMYGRGDNVPAKLGVRRRRRRRLVVAGAAALLASAGAAYGMVRGPVMGKVAELPPHSQPQLEMGAIAVDPTPQAAPAED